MSERDLFGLWENIHLASSNLRENQIMVLVTKIKHVKPEVAEVV